MPKLLLINPVGRRSGLLMSKVSRFAPLGLAYAAALTPAHWQIKILDENFAAFEYEPADLVGITAFTSNINRAYEIARVYRDKQIKVVLGGIHASMVPNEALENVDAVVVGEVEGIWPRVLEDFEKQCLRPIYHGPKIEMDKPNVRPRRDLLHPDYIWHSVQTSRGCPFNCSFCSVSRYLGKAYRKRSVEDVLDELDEISGRNIAFVDDNLIGNSEADKARAKALFKGMLARQMGKRWWMQTSINAAEDEEVIELAAAAGCLFVFIGFETIDLEALRQMHKGVNIKLGIDNYRKVVRAFHRHGIAVLGAFILGFDFENEAYYTRLARFLLATGVDIFQITLLTPLPGTDLLAQLQQQKRLICENYPQDWDKYRFSYIVHRTQGVSADEIYAGNNYIKSKLYGFPYYHLRLLRSWWEMKNFRNSFVAYKMNQAFKKGWQNSQYFGKY